MAFNLALRFLLELVVLVAFTYWGFQSGDSLFQQLLLGTGLLVLIMVVWGMFVSPKAPYRLQIAPRIGVELLIFTLVTWALYSVGFTYIAFGFIALVILNQILLSLFDQRG